MAVDCLSDQQTNRRKNVIEEDLNREFQIGDKVKKQVFVGYSPPGKPRVQLTEFIYGKIEFIDEHYFYVKFKGASIPDNEIKSDIMHVSKAEWDAMFKT